MRIANALTRYKSENVTIVGTIAEADTVVLYVIGADTQQTVADLKLVNKKYIIVQCCLKGTALSIPSWVEIWKSASLVWSYYDLSEYGLDNFYHAPLGIDDVFKPEVGDVLDSERDIAIVSSGFMAYPSEAIEEVANAALRLGQRVVHVGPKHISGMNSRSEKSWEAVQPDDRELAKIYSRSRFVSGLRFMEGFEMPVIEGLSCGAIPIVFDRPETRQWFSDFSYLIPECSGRELEDILVGIMNTSVSSNWYHSPNAIETARNGVFNWKNIVEGFWSRIQ